MQELAAVGARDTVRAYSQLGLYRSDGELSSRAVLQLILIPKSEFDRVHGADPDAKLVLLAGLCRLNALVAIRRAGSGHIGSSFSAVDVVVHLLYDKLNVAELGLEHPDRDVFFSSFFFFSFFSSSASCCCSAGSTAIRTWAFRGSRPTPCGTPEEALRLHGLDGETLAQRIAAELGIRTGA